MIDNFMAEDNDNNIDVIPIPGNEHVDDIEVPPQHNMNRNIIGQSWLNVDKVNILPSRTRSGTMNFIVHETLCR